MKKFSTFAAGAVVLGLTLTGCSGEPEAPAVEEPAAASQFSQELHDLLPDSVKDSGELNFVGDPNAPFRVIDENGKVTGLQADILTEFAEILGVEIKTENVTGLAAVKLGVQSGRNDAAFGPLLDTPKTEEDLDFIIYSTARPTFLHKADAKISSVLDLCGTTVSYTDGSVAAERALTSIDEKCAAAGKDAPEHLALADANATIMAVDSGRADSSTLSAAAAAYAITQQGDKYGMYVSDETEFMTDYLGIGVLKENTGLRDALLGAWEVLFDTGVYEDIMMSHNLGATMVDAPGINYATTKK